MILFDINLIIKMSLSKLHKKCYMKVLKLTIALFSVTVSLTSFINNEKDFSLGRVNKTSNKLIFFWSEPTNNYDVAFTFMNKIANYNCKSPQQIIDATIQNANIEAANQGKIYDAIIIGTSERDMAVVWGDKAKDNSIARVKKTEGKLVFIECEPLVNYDIVGKYNVSAAAQALLTGTCPNHQSKIDKLVKKASKDNITFDAIMYGSTEKDLVIKFK